MIQKSDPESGLPPQGRLCATVHEVEEIKTARHPERSPFYLVLLAAISSIVAIARRGARSVRAPGNSRAQATLPRRPQDIWPG